MKVKLTGFDSDSGEIHVDLERLLAIRVDDTNCKVYAVFAGMGCMQFHYKHKELLLKAFYGDTTIAS